MARPQRRNERRDRPGYPARSCQPPAHRGWVDASHAGESDLSHAQVGDGNAEFGWRHD